LIKKLGFTLSAIVVYASSMLQNPAQVKPEAYKIEIDNAQVQVTRSVHAPHEKVPMHSHRDAVVVYLTDVHEKSTYPDGTSKEIRHRAGDVVWSTAHTHALENLADEPIRVIEIEPKTAAPAAASKSEGAASPR
jgi:quercetin dioxygenase-like cupin family protein